MQIEVQVKLWWEPRTRDELPSFEMTEGAKAGDTQPGEWALRHSSSRELPTFGTTREMRRVIAARWMDTEMGQEPKTREEERDWGDCHREMDLTWHVRKVTVQHWR